MPPNLGSMVLSLSVPAFWSPSPHSPPRVLVTPLFSKAGAGQASTDFLLLPMCVACWVHSTGCGHLGGARRWSWASGRGSGSELLRLHLCLRLSWPPPLPLPSPGSHGLPIPPSQPASGTLGLTEQGWPVSRGGRGLSVLPLVPKACAEGRGGLGDPEFSCFVCNGFTGMRVTTQEAHPFQRLSAVLPRAAMAPVNQVQHMSIPLAAIPHDHCFTVPPPPSLQQPLLYVLCLQSGLCGHATRGESHHECSPVSGARTRLTDLVVPTSHPSRPSHHRGWSHGKGVLFTRQWTSRLFECPRSGLYVDRRSHF